MKTKAIKYFLLTKTFGLYINMLGLFSDKKAAQKAYQLFCKPRKGKINENNCPEVLQEAKQEEVFIENQFCKVYVWAGNDDIVLLMHGWESNASRWKKLLPQLKKTGKTIVAIDAPAHGQSSGHEFNVPKYVKFVTAVTQKYNPKYIIGHSIGGFASLYYQYSNQNKNLQKIILLGAPSDLELMLDNYCKLLSLNNTVKIALRIFSESIVLMKVDDFSGKNFAKTITTPTLIIHDVQDVVVSINESRKIYANHPNATLLETTDFGHGLNNKKIFEEIIRFLN